MQSLNIIIPVSDAYTKYLPDLLANIASHIMVDYGVIIADNTTAQDIAEGGKVRVVKMGGNKGIFAAKMKAFELCAPDTWVTFIDADDYYCSNLINLEFDKPINYFAKFARAVKSVTECQQPYTWRFIVSRETLADAYHRINIAASAAGLLLDEIVINSCEDILLCSQLAGEVQVHQYDLVEHTRNDDSATNSDCYTAEKVKNLFGDWKTLLNIAKGLAFHSQWVIAIMCQCYSQYHFNMRPNLSYAEKEECDRYVKALQEL